MNTLSELISYRRKLVRDVAFVAAEDCTTIAKAIFVIVSTWQGNSKFITIIAQIVRSNHITPLNKFRGQIIGWEAIQGLRDHLSL